MRVERTQIGAEDSLDPNDEFPHGTPCPYMDRHATLKPGRLAPVLNAAFWNLFSDDYVSNCLAWHRAEEPILPPSGEGWKCRWTANPDIVSYYGRQLLYYRGSGTFGNRPHLQDRIGAAQIVQIEPGVLRLIDLNGDRPIIDVGHEGAFDENDVLDPAAIEFQNRLWLYYSAIGPKEDSIGLATSEDGEEFEKWGWIMMGRAPDVIVKDNKIFMTYQLADADGNYNLHLASSTDGIAFTPVVDEPIFPRPAESWDSKSFVTGRLSEEDGVYYMIYGGSSYLADEPEYFGLARSADLISWHPHPGNPIFGCGRKGAPDGGAIWFPALHETDDAFVMLYEGSRGKYSFDLSSAICMSWIDKPIQTS